MISALISCAVSLRVKKHEIPDDLTSLPTLSKDDFEEKKFTQKVDHFGEEKKEFKQRYFIHKDNSDSDLLFLQICGE